MPHFVPEEETLDRARLEALQRQKLGRLLVCVLSSNPFYQRKLAGCSPDTPLAELPLTTRADIQHDQQDNPPFGSNLSFPLRDYCRYHQTSGTSGRPVRWLDRDEDWQWWKRCWGIIYRAAGVNDDDRFMFPFSFGPFIGFWAAFESAVALGNLCLPAGGMTTIARLHHMIDNDVTIVGCTPTYAMRMAEVAHAEGIDLAASRVRTLIVAGEPGGSIPAVRERIERTWGARVFDHAGMTEIGPYGFECIDAPGGQYVIESEFIAEVLDPYTGMPVPEGSTGELVLTNLGRLGSPLIRYRTGDHVRLRIDRPAESRAFAWLEGGILGRIDDMLVIRGNNVYPTAIEAILREFDDVAEFRLAARQHGSSTELTIEIESAPGAASDTLAARVAGAIRDRLHFRPDVAIAPPGSLPRFEMKARRLVRQDDQDAAGRP